MGDWRARSRAGGERGRGEEEEEEEEEEERGQMWRVCLGRSRRERVGGWVGE